MRSMRAAGLFAIVERRRWKNTPGGMAAPYQLNTYGATPAQQAATLAATPPPPPAYSGLGSGSMPLGGSPVSAPSLPQNAASAGGFPAYGSPLPMGGSFAQNTNQPIGAPYQLNTYGATPAQQAATLAARPPPPPAYSGLASGSGTRLPPPVPLSGLKLPQGLNTLPPGYFGLQGTPGN